LELANLEYFSELSKEQITLLHSFSRKHHFKKGAFLFFAGDSSETLHILTKGVLNIFKSDSKGNEVSLHRFQPVTMVAEIACLQQRPYPANARFETDGETIGIHFPSFEKHLLSDTAVTKNLLISLSRKITSLETFIDNNMVLDVTSRLCRFLYENESLFFKQKQVQIADTLGMKPETLSRILKKLKDHGITLDKNKKQIIGKELLLDFIT
jgi:CRP/FNR family transcriptional regulator